MIMFDFAADTAADLALIIRFHKISLGPLTRIGPGLQARRGRPIDDRPLKRNSASHLKPFTVARRWPTNFLGQF